MVTDSTLRDVLLRLAEELSWLGSTRFVVTDRWPVEEIADDEQVVVLARTAADGRRAVDDPRVAAVATPEVVHEAPDLMTAALAPRAKVIHEAAAARAAACPPVTPRQGELLELAVAGTTILDSAAHIGVAEVTARRELRALRKLIGVVTHAELIVAVIELGLVDDPRAGHPDERSPR